MKEHIKAAIRKLISPSMRFELRETAAWLGEQLNLARIWRWEIARLPQREGIQYSILYFGQKVHHAVANMILLGFEGIGDTSHAGSKPSGQTVLISEMPIPGALCLPKYLRAIVPLRRSIEEIMAEYDSELRRSLRKNRPHYRMKQVLNDAEIEYADRELLRPYASARHGSNANQMPLDTVRRIAQEIGRLDFVYKGDDLVACLLGYEYVCAGKHYWMLDRFGYPEAVFSDPKRLGETNSMNNHLELEWAIENGYDYYDIALVFARPDDGLLKWKKRRGAALSTVGLRGYSHFHIRLPKAGTAQFLWDSPLFAIERRKLTLHLGLPDGLNDDEISKRYREMGFAGLFKVYLHCAKPPGEGLLETLRGFYAHQKSPPIVEIRPST
jgi:hypothetical protein